MEDKGNSKPVNGVRVFIPGKFTCYRIATADSDYEVAVIEARTRELALERVRLVRHLLPWLAREAVELARVGRTADASRPMVAQRDVHQRVLHRISRGLRR